MVTQLKIKLQNTKYSSEVKLFTFRNMGYVDKEKCIDKGLKWFCFSDPCITLISEVKKLPQNKILHELKYKQLTEYLDLRDILIGGVKITEPIASIDEEGLLKVSVLSSNISNSVRRLMPSLQRLGLDNSKKDLLSIPITYIKKDTISDDRFKLIEGCQLLIPKTYQVLGFVLCSPEKEILINY